MNLLPNSNGLPPSLVQLRIVDAVLGNAGTIISFRVGAEDAPYLAREFVGQFHEADLVQLPNYSIYLKLMIDGMPSRPFSARTLKMTNPFERLDFER